MVLISYQCDFLEGCRTGRQWRSTTTHACEIEFGGIQHGRRFTDESANSRPEFTNQTKKAELIKE
jgi:hypothetical protein